MKMMMDVKTLVIGFLLGALFVFALGAYRASDAASFGIAVPANGTILVKSEKGYAYLVNGATGKAIPVSFVAESKSKIKLH